MAKIKIVFLFQAGSFWPSWEALYDVLRKDERFEVKILWIRWQEGKPGDRAQMQYAEKFLIEKNLPYEEFSYEYVVHYKPEYLVFQLPYESWHREHEAWSIRFKWLGIKVIYIPYGIEISDTKESRYMHFSFSTVLNADYIFTLADGIKEEYEKYCANYQAVYATGLPRFDSLQREFPLAQNVLQKREGRKILLWKVHFPKSFVENGVKKQVTPDLREYLKFVEWIEHNHNLFFIFMPHPKFADEDVEPEQRTYAREIVTRLSRIQHVHIDMEEDYRNSLVNADAVISDRSSVMIEAGYKGIPVMYMYNREYEEPMTKTCQTILDSYYQGTTVQDMIKFCENVEQGIDSRRSERINIYQHTLNRCDGNCSERIKNILVADAGNPGKNIRKMPQRNSKVIIFGTGKLGEKCMQYNEKKDVPFFQVLCSVDNNSQKKGTDFHGTKVICPSDISQWDYDYVVIASDRYYKEIYLQLRNEIGIPKENIMNFDEFIIATMYGV